MTGVIAGPCFWCKKADPDRMILLRKTRKEQASYHPVCPRCAAIPSVLHVTEYTAYRHPDGRWTESPDA